MRLRLYIRNRETGIPKVFCDCVLQRKKSYGIMQYCKHETGDDMSKQDDMLQEWNDECVQTIKTASANVDTVIEQSAEQFQKNSLDNIPQQFGDFLYAALGDRVTGQRSSVLNDLYFAENRTGKRMTESAETAGMDLIDYIKKIQKERHSLSKWERTYSSAPTEVQAYLTAGRKFGISYLTSNGERVHTMYFGSGQSFRFIRKEHVSCVKNRLKKECTQDFIDFRDDFFAGIQELSSEMVAINAPARLAQVSWVSKTDKLREHGGTYIHKPTQYIIMDGILDSTITHVICVLPKLDIWNGYDNVTSGELKKNDIYCPTFISLLFLHINEETSQYSIVANVDMDMKNTAHTLQLAHNWNVQNTTHLVEGHQSIRNNYRYDRSILSETPYSNYTATDAAGIILNLDEVLKNPTVEAMMEKRIKFFNDMSERLQQLKHSHATLYFINGDM